MTQITLEKEELQNFVKQLDMLLRSAKQTENYRNKRHVEQKIEPLDNQEKAVINFIKKNPGTSKQQIVDSVDYSRNTIYKAIGRLRSYGMIIEELDKKSNRKLELYSNNKSLFLSVIDDLERFKKSYLNLIKAAVERQKKIDDPNESYSWDVTSNLLFILKQLIAGYSIQAVFEWPKIIQDSEGLNRLYLTVFQSINEMLVELAKYVPFHINDEKEKLEFINRDLTFPFQESQEFERMINEFTEYNLDPEYDAVMSNLFRASKMPREWIIYRNGLMEK
jgi:biotin operon repressor